MTTCKSRAAAVSTEKLSTSFPDTREGFKIWRLEAKKLIKEDVAKLKIKEPVIEKLSFKDGRDYLIHGLFRCGEGQNLGARVSEKKILLLLHDKARPEVTPRVIYYCALEDRSMLPEYRTIGRAYWDFHDWGPRPSPGSPKERVWIDPSRS